MPAPYWAAVSPVLIPLQTCNRAADLLIEWFGPEDLRTVVGGEKWWQVRGLDGIDAEWIAQKEYLSERPAQTVGGPKLSAEDTNILRMEHLETVMVSIFTSLHNSTCYSLLGLLLCSYTFMAVGYSTLSYRRVYLTCSPPRRVLLGVHQYVTP